MPKPAWSMKPPKLQAVADAPQSAKDAFVAGEAPKRSNAKTPKRSGTQTSKRSDAQTSKRPSDQVSKAVVRRVDGRELRRMTVYLPTDLAARLRVHCAETDVDLSTFLADAVAGRLNV